MPKTGIFEAFRIGLTERQRPPELPAGVGRTVPCRIGFKKADDARLQGGQPCCKHLPSGNGGGDVPLVPIKNGQGDTDTETITVGTAIEFIAGAQMDVGI